jgi:hypothetical protein
MMPHFHPQQHFAPPPPQQYPRFNPNQQFARPPNQRNQQLAPNQQQFGYNNGGMGLYRGYDGHRGFHRR